MNIKKKFITKILFIYLFFPLYINGNDYEESLDSKMSIIQCPKTLSNVKLPNVVPNKIPSDWHLLEKDSDDPRLFLRVFEHTIKDGSFICKYSLQKDYPEFTVINLTRKVPPNYKCNLEDNYKFKCIEIEKYDAQKNITLDAPKLLYPENKTIFSHYPRKTKVAWTKVKNAFSYSVEIEVCSATCWKDKRLSESGLIKNEYEFFFVGAQKGRWRVIANDFDGNKGTPSKWREFLYTG